MAERGPDLFAAPPPPELTEEQAANKRQMYEAMSPRRRRFVDRMGFDAWDPFQKPKEPMDIRMDSSGRTTQELVRLFLRNKSRENGTTPGNAYSQGVLDCALGVVNKDEKYRGVYEFCLWYNELLQRGGK